MPVLLHPEAKPFWFKPFPYLKSLLTVLLGFVWLAGGIMFSREDKRQVIIVRSQPEQHCSSTSASTTCALEAAASSQDRKDVCPDGGNGSGQEATSAAEQVTYDHTLAA